MVTLEELSGLEQLVLRSVVEGSLDHRSPSGFRWDPDGPLPRAATAAEAEAVSALLDLTVLTAPHRLVLATELGMSLYWQLTRTRGAGGGVAALNSRVVTAVRWVKLALDTFSGRCDLSPDEVHVRGELVNVLAALHAVRRDVQRMGRDGAGG